MTWELGDSLLLEEALENAARVIVIEARRERIATAYLSGMAAGAGGAPPKYAAHISVLYADALIAELDKPKEVKP